MYKNVIRCTTYTRYTKGTKYMRYIRYSQCTRCIKCKRYTRYIYKMYKIYKIYKIYEMYKIYKMYKIYEIYEEGMKKYKKDGKYPNQYSFYNRARNRLLAKDLSFWGDNKNTREPTLAIWPSWKLNSTFDLKWLGPAAKKHFQPLSTTWSYSSI